MGGTEQTKICATFIIILYLKIKQNQAFFIELKPILLTFCSVPHPREML